MSWDEIYDEGQIAAIVVPPNSVILKTVHRTFGKNKSTVHYLFNLLLGVDVLKKLSWTTETTLKFQWGTEDNLGLVRVAVILNESTGWKARIYRNGYGLVSNKALPKKDPQVNKIERHVELVYSIVEDPRKAGVYILELKLPEDFYEGNIQGKNLKTQIDSQIPEISKRISVTSLTSKEVESLNSTKSVPAARPTTASKNPVTPVAQKPVETKKETESSGPITAYDKAVKDGGPISIDDLCKFIRVFMGDSATILGQLVVINDVQGSPSKALAYANNYRVQKGQPIFSIRQ